MPGDNCAVFGCGTSRRIKGIGIWKLPAPRNAEYKKWRDDWLNELTKSREIDKDFEVKSAMTLYTLARNIFVQKI